MKNKKIEKKVKKFNEVQNTNTGLITVTKENAWQVKIKLLEAINKNLITVITLLNKENK